MSKTEGALLIASIAVWATGYGWGFLRGMRQGMREGRRGAAQDWIVGNNFIFAAEERRIMLERDPWAP